jgi:hypothetical protein
MFGNLRVWYVHVCSINTQRGLWVQCTQYRASRVRMIIVTTNQFHYYEKSNLSAKIMKCRVCDVPGNLQYLTRSSYWSSPHDSHATPSPPVMSSSLSSRLLHTEKDVRNICHNTFLRTPSESTNLSSASMCFKVHYDYSVVLRDLHWLPIRQRVQFKLLVLVFKCRNGSAPQYLSELLLPYAPCQSLRSESRSPRYRLEVYGSKTFTVIASRLWNCLPSNLKEADSLTAFKSLLKTHLFSVAYGQ